jgi:hypothetical protein
MQVDWGAGRVQKSGAPNWVNALCAAIDLATRQRANRAANDQARHAVVAAAGIVAWTENNNRFVAGQDGK